MENPLTLRDATIWPGLLDSAAQVALADDIRAVVRQAPLFTPVTPRGQAMSVRMTAAGTHGWISDRRGYRYETHHPSGAPWPPIPDSILALWRRVAPDARMPDCCLINWYGPGARMGLHQDRDEADFTQPVVSVSLGDDGLFRIGNDTRGGKTDSVWLRSGDVLVLGGAARLRFHGIDRIRPGTSALFDTAGRLNLTLRVVT